eukprot:gnl/Hemi2/22522_TR7509_c0_g1_i1.p1 gnl/Hemi2/22522_TR7509_c0_g1~~gnl/Hemi2/22522_TR7509_c0_g1_i1.p1  ORF type:complete len:256 (+),score=52.34 gnl/Hemi2/22522_TR7509_c0_g1_i1:58-768(+)
MQEEYSLDLAELKSLLAQAVRSRNRTCLENQISTVEAKLKQEQAKTPISPVGAASPTAPPPPASSSSSTTPSATTPAPAPVGDFTTISSFSYDQSPKTVTVYVSLPDVGSLPKDAVDVVFTSTSLSLTVRGLGGRNHRLFVPQLCHEIIPDKSEFSVRPSRVNIKLAKKESTHWEDLRPKKEKFKPKASDVEDPSAGIMNLMKNLYDEGDDQMKQTIAKAWTESRNKGGAGGLGGF